MATLVEKGFLEIGFIKRKSSLDAPSFDDLHSARLTSLVDRVDVVRYVRYYGALPCFRSIVDNENFIVIEDFYVLYV